MSARNRELLALVPASLLVTAGFAAVFIQRSDQLSDVSLTYGAVFLALCLAAHIFLRFALPYADPYLFPLVARNDVDASGATQGGLYRSLSVALRLLALEEVAQTSFSFR